jgi:hypothetical protein
MNRDHNIGAFIAAIDSGVDFNSVAAGSNDNTEKAGAIIDRVAHKSPLSMSLLIAYTAVLSAANTIKIGYRIEHGNDPALADTADFAALTIANAAVLATGAGTKTGVVKVDLDLGGAHRYLRVNITDDLSAANTDTSVCGAVVIFGGEDVVPSI